MASNKGIFPTIRLKPQKWLQSKNGWLCECYFPSFGETLNETAAGNKPIGAVNFLSRKLPLKLNLCLLKIPQSPEAFNIDTFPSVFSPQIVRQLCIYKHSETFGESSALKEANRIGSEQR